VFDNYSPAPVSHDKVILGRCLITLRAISFILKCLEKLFRPVKHDRKTIVLRADNSDTYIT